MDRSCTRFSLKGEKKTILTLLLLLLLNPALQAEVSPQGLRVEEDRLTFPKASYSAWEDSKMPRGLREWISAWIKSQK